MDKTIIPQSSTSCYYHSVKVPNADTKKEIELKNKRDILQIRGRKILQNQRAIDNDALPKWIISRDAIKIGFHSPTHLEPRTRKQSYVYFCAEKARRKFFAIVFSSFAFLIIYLNKTTPYWSLSKIESPSSNFFSRIPKH